MQGKSKYYFPNHLLFAALANILGRANPNIIPPPYFMRKRGFWFLHKKPQPRLGKFYFNLSCFLFPA